MPSYAILSEETREDGKVTYKALFRLDDGHEEVQQYTERENGEGEKILEDATRHMNIQRQEVLEKQDISDEAVEEKPLVFKEVI